jgi:hypothetical protein
MFLRPSATLVDLVWSQGIDICMHRSKAAMAAKVKSGRMLFPKFDRGSML